MIVALFLVFKQETTETDVADVFQPFEVGHGHAAGIGENILIGGKDIG